MRFGRRVSQTNTVTVSELHFHYTIIETLLHYSNVYSSYSLSFPCQTVFLLLKRVKKHLKTEAVLSVFVVELMLHLLFWPLGGLHVSTSEELQAEICCCCCGTAHEHQIHSLKTWKFILFLSSSSFIYFIAYLLPYSLCCLCKNGKISWNNSGIWKQFL